MSNVTSTQITFHAGNVSRGDRAKLFRQQGCTVWFTGLSASGKSTIAIMVEQMLLASGHAAYRLDGDNIRFGLNASGKILMESRGLAEASAKRFGLGFSAEDREENIRRIGEVAKLFADAGLIAITSFISPYRKDRDAARKAHDKAEGSPIPFIEVFVDTPIDLCEQRDPKGLYKQARDAVAAGKGMGFTGVDDPYEAPAQPELVLKAGELSVEACAQQVIDLLRSRGLLQA